MLTELGNRRHTERCPSPKDYRARDIPRRSTVREAVEAYLPRLTLKSQSLEDAWEAWGIGEGRRRL